MTNLDIKFLILLILGLGAFLVINEYLSTGSLLAFVALLLNLDEASNRFADISPLFFQAVGGMHRIEEPEKLKPDSADYPDALMLHPLRQ